MGVLPNLAWFKLLHFFQHLSYSLIWKPELGQKPNQELGQTEPKSEKQQQENAGIFWTFLLTASYPCFFLIFQSLCMAFQILCLSCCLHSPLPFFHNIIQHLYCLLQFLQRSAQVLTAQLLPSMGYEKGRRFLWAYLVSHFLNQSNTQIMWWEINVMLFLFMLYILCDWL